jgi:hypothetical protein
MAGRIAADAVPAHQGGERSVAGVMVHGTVLVTGRGLKWHDDGDEQQGEILGCVRKSSSSGSLLRSR